MKAVGIHPEYVKLEIDNAQLTASCLRKGIQTGYVPRTQNGSRLCQQEFVWLPRVSLSGLSVELCWVFCSHYPVRRCACFLSTHGYR